MRSCTPEKYPVALATIAMSVHRAVCAYYNSSSSITQFRGFNTDIFSRAAWPAALRLHVARGLDCVAS